MTPSADYTNQPFDEAIKFFRDKDNLPTTTWKDLWRDMHARAFVTAGGTKSDFLADMRDAVDQAISQGTTLEEFRRDFDDIVGRHGWQYKGGRAWRSALIYQTNLSTAYAAGHWQAMTDPDVLAARPYLRYVASSAAHPRPEHMAWYNIVLPADHPWWQTHYPPNGWGCQCGAVSQSAREVEKLTEEEADGPHPISTTAPPDQTYEWTDKETGEVHQVPVGIDPGWDYNVGRAAWGQRLSEASMDAWRVQGSDAWENLTPGDWQLAGQPEIISPDIPNATVGPKATTIEAAIRQITEINGGAASKLYLTPDGGGVIVNAVALAKHIDLARSPYLPLLPEAIESPQEIWLSFERHKGTGRVELKQRIIKIVQLTNKKAILVTAQIKDGVLEAWTMIPTAKTGYINKQRVGKLLWGGK